MFLQWHFKNLAQNRSHIFTRRVVKQTSVCEREGVSFLWVFIFHSCSSSFFLPVQTKILCQHGAWCFLTLKFLIVTNFLLSFQFFGVTDFLLHFLKAPIPSKLHKQHGPRDYLDFWLVFQRAQLCFSLTRDSTTLEYIIKSRDFTACLACSESMLINYTLIWSRCVNLPPSNNTSCLPPWTDRSPAQAARAVKSTET